VGGWPWGGGVARAQGYLAPTLALRAWRSPRSIAAAKMKPRKIESRETIGPRELEHLEFERVRGAWRAWPSSDRPERRAHGATRIQLR